MTPKPTDASGVPVLSASDIEIKAEELISYFDSSLLTRAISTPLIEIVRNLHENFGLISDYSLDLGLTQNGNKILGKTQLKPLGLFVDRSLVDNPRFEFVLGHELGHAVLHGEIDVKNSGYDEQELADTKQDFVTGKKLLLTARDWIEWQANRFASAVLMPRATVHSAVQEKQRKMGITRNLGKIILTEEPYSRRDFMAVVERIREIYSVNATNVQYRLTDLGILDDHRKMNVKHISELFKTD